MAVKVYFKRTLSLIILVCFLTLLVFVSLNKPKEVKAEVISAVTLGVGALAVLVASYFSVAGIEISQTGGEGTTYFEDFINDTVQKYKQADANNKAIAEQYFDDSGRFIGSEEELQMIISPQAQGYWSMGKGVNSFLESLKSWFVTENSLNVGTSVILDFATTVPSNIGPLPIYNITQVSASNWPISLIGNEVGDTVSISLGDDPADNFNLTVLSNNASTNKIQIMIQNGYSNYRTFSVSAPFSIFLYFKNNYQDIALGMIRNNEASASDASFFSRSVTNYTISNLTLDGSLTDGYDDFQDALDNDLANEAENEEAVVVTGVGEVGTDLTYEQIKELILQNVITGELNPTYEGTYENQDTAEEELDKENPIVIPDWRPTPVIVNGLEDFFPFCIPFDLYAVIELLNAEPVAPKFTGHLDFADIFEDQDIELDFSQFDYLARIVRTIIVIAFLIFIILKTRDMIRG